MTMLSRNEGIFIEDIVNNPQLNWWWPGVSKNINLNWDFLFKIIQIKIGIIWELYLMK